MTYSVEELLVEEHSFRIQPADRDGNMIEGLFNDSGEINLSLVKHTLHLIASVQFQRYLLF